MKVIPFSKSIMQDGLRRKIRKGKERSDFLFSIQFHTGKGTEQELKIIPIPFLLLLQDELDPSWTTLNSQDHLQGCQVNAFQLHILNIFR